MNASGNFQIWSGGLWTQEWAQHFPLNEIGCGEMLSLTHQQDVLDFHRGLLEAGADVISTNTFAANRNVMAEHGNGKFVYEANFESARTARLATKDFSTSGTRCLIAGSIGPTWMGAATVGLSQLQRVEVYEGYVEQITALIEGGVDMLHVEGCQDLLIAHSALLAAMDVQSQLGKHMPTVCTASIELGSLMLDGHSYNEFYEMTRSFKLLARGLSGNALALQQMDLSEIAAPGALFGDIFLHSFGWVAPPDSAASILGTLARIAKAVIVGIGRGTRADYVTALVKALR